MPSRLDQWKVGHARIPRRLKCIQPNIRWTVLTQPSWGTAVLAFLLTNRKCYNVVYPRFLTKGLKVWLGWFHRLNLLFVKDKQFLLFSIPLPKMNTLYSTKENSSEFTMWVPLGWVFLFHLSLLFGFSPLGAVSFLWRKVAARWREGKFFSLIYVRLFVYFCFFLNVFSN